MPVSVFREPRNRSPPNPQPRVFTVMAWTDTAINCPSSSRIMQNSSNPTNQSKEDPGRVGEEENHSVSQVHCILP